MPWEREREAVPQVLLLLPCHSLREPIPGVHRVHYIILLDKT